MAVAVIICAVSERCKKIACAEEKSGKSRERPRIIAIAEVTEERYRQVHSELGGNRDSVDLKLAVAEASLE